MACRITSPATATIMAMIRFAARGDSVTNRRLLRRSTDLFPVLAKTVLAEITAPQVRNLR